VKKRDVLWKKVQRDFPNDRALQEVHYARLRIHEKTKGMTPAQFLEYIKARAKKVLAGHAGQTAASGRMP